MNTYYVYILTTNNNKIFYVWITNDLSRRIYEHKNKLVDWFTKKYNVTKLVYYEEWGSVKDAIQRENELKDRRRDKKLLLVKELNPTLEELVL